ncbi:MAG: hypothetical protein K1X88_34895 [Nannocystaceae bacterium]|nr:hypothetical protein [Nannocystaceae bacterium]
MPWLVHDGDAVIELRPEIGGGRGEGEPMSERALELLLSRIATDAWGRSTLRSVYFDLIAFGQGGSVSDDLVLAEVLDAAARGTLRGYRSEAPRTVTGAGGGAGAALSDLVEGTALAELASTPAPAPLPAAVRHQIDILARASQQGAPFCEECECADDGAA